MARYWLRFGDREVALPDGELLVGRGVDCHVRLVAPSVSRRHLRLLTIADEVMAYDLGSRNGTWVNDVRLEGALPLHDGDVIRVGTQSFGLREAVEAAEEEGDPETWDMVLDKAPPPVGASSLRSTIEMDQATLLKAVAESRGLAATREAGLAVGRQTCSSCGQAFEVGQPFCPHCLTEPYSAPRYRTCRGCKALLSESDEFCPSCGLERSDRRVATTEERGEERRREARRPASIHGLYVSSSLTFEADVTNISRGGLFIVAELLDPVGTSADIVLSIDGESRARFSGEVAHVVDDPDPPSGGQPGMGIKFTDMAPRARGWLLAFLRERESASKV